MARKIVNGTLFLLLVFGLALLAFAERDVRDAPRRTTQAFADSADSLIREKATTPSTRTDYAHDSLSKPDNIFLEILGLYVDTSGRYKRNDDVRYWKTVRGFQSNDSSRLYKGEGCLKVELRPRANVTQVDTIVWRDTCASVGGCVPLIGDYDRIYRDLCDSIRIVTEGPHLDQTYWREDPLSGLVKDLVIRIDTILSPYTFQIYTGRGNGSPVSQEDTTVTNPMAKMFKFTSYIGNGHGYPLLKQTFIRGFSWVSRQTAGSLTGGSVMLPLPQGIPAGKQLYVKWVTNPATRDISNNKTKISLWTSDLGNGSATNTLTNIAIVEIEDAAHSTADPNQILINLTVWGYTKSL
jgi:hypothetical protein